MSNFSFQRNLQHDSTYTFLTKNFNEKITKSMINKSWTESYFVRFVGENKSNIIDCGK